MSMVRYLLAIWVMLALAVGLAVARAIAGLGSETKWPPRV